MTDDKEIKPWIVLIRAISLPAVLLILIVLVDRETIVIPLPSDQKDQLVRILYLLTGAYILYLLISHLVIDGLMARGTGKPIPRILHHIIAIVVATLAILLSIQTIWSGAFNGILAFSSVIGVVVGLALRPIILDVFSGLSSNLDAAFQIDDWVEVSVDDGKLSYRGWIEQVNWRTTHIRTRAGNMVICPNSLIGNSVVLNYSRPWALSRCELDISLPPELDTTRAKRILQAAVDSAIGLPDGPDGSNPPEILLVGLVDSIAQYRIRYWIDLSEKSETTVSSTISESALKHLNIAGIPLGEPAILNREERRLPAHGFESRRVEILSQLDLFRGLDEEELGSLANALEIKPFSPGEVLVAQGDQGDSMFAIIEGGVEIVVEVDGTETTVAQMLAGDYFGEISMLTDEPRTATVRARTSGTLFVISRESMDALITKAPSILDLISRNLVERNLNRVTMIEEFRNSNTPEKRTTIISGLLAKMKRVFLKS